MKKEDVYADQMRALGIYEDAFLPAIHSLCIQERELSRTMKDWKKSAPEDSAPSALDPLYKVILEQRRAILLLRETLGLTPKGLQKLRGSQPAASPENSKAQIGAKLDAMLLKVSGYESPTL